MANRNLKRDRGALEKGLVDVYANVAIGSSGAPTLTAKQNYGIASVVRVSAGLYTITLQDKFARIVDFNANFLNSTGAHTIFQVVLKADSVSTSTPSFQIQCNNASGTATDPSSGATMILHVDLKNSGIGA